jgi:hypothetical protein
VGTAAIATRPQGWFEAAETLALDTPDRAFVLGALDQPMPAIPTLLPLTAHGAATSYPIGLRIGLPTLSALGAVVREMSGLGSRLALWWIGVAAGPVPGSPSPSG